MIEFSSVYKRYGNQQVLKNLNFTIKEGEIVGFLGPNGAGKTTTLRSMTGLLPVTSGKVRIEGDDPLEEATIRGKIGFLPENNPLYDDMTVEEWLMYWSEVKFREVRKSDILKAVELTGLEDVYYRFIGELSKGYRQRAGLAQAILARPQVIVLDEPTEGLDPNQRSDIHSLIRDLGSKRTVIISSHILSEVNKMCDRVMIINRGEVVADGEPDTLTAQLGQEQTVIAHISGRSVLRNLQKIQGVTDVKEEKQGRGKPDHYIIFSETNPGIGLEVFNLAKKHNWKLYELVRQQAQLEDVFAKLTT